MKKKTEEWGPFPLRLGLAILFFHDASRLLFGMFGGEGLRGAAAHFDRIGLRPGLVFVLTIGLLKLVGAISLAGGVLTRPAAVTLGLLVLFETWFRGAEALFSPLSPSYEIAVLVALICLSLTLSGPKKGTLK